MTTHTYDVVIGRNYRHGWGICRRQVYHARLGTTVTVPESAGEIDVDESDDERAIIAAAVDAAAAAGHQVIDGAQHYTGHGVDWDDMRRTADIQFAANYVVVHVIDDSD